MNDDLSMIEELQERGYVIIPDLLSEDTLSTLRLQIGAYLGSVKPDTENAFMGKKTRRFGRLLYRIPETRTLVRHPTILELVRHVLVGPRSPTFQLHFTGVMHLEEDAEAQVLHRDANPIEDYPPLSVGVMWAISEFTVSNGATILASGSHRWGDSAQPIWDDMVAAEMPEGSCLVYLGNVIHGAGACHSGSRTGLNIQYSVGWLRQEENQYLATPLEVAKTFDDDLLKLMGYDLAARHWGYVDQTHPLRFLRDGDNAQVGGLDPPGYEFKNQRNYYTLDED